MSAVAQVHSVRVPFPTQRLYDQPDQVCLTVNTDFRVHEVEVEDGRFSAKCETHGGSTRVCMRLLTPTWPSRFAPLRCEGDRGTLRMVPVPAFDPTEDISDGVRIVRRVDVLQAAFHTELPDAVGLMEAGSCGVKQKQLWVRAAPAPKRQECRLVFADTSERIVPVVLVSKL